jgi:hypothetical protein
MTVYYIFNGWVRSAADSMMLMSQISRFLLASTIMQMQDSLSAKHLLSPKQGEHYHVAEWGCSAQR